MTKSSAMYVIPAKAGIQDNPLIRLDPLLSQRMTQVENSIQVAEDLIEAKTSNDKISVAKNSQKTALLAAAFLGSSLLLIIESHLVVTDAVLLFTMVLMQGALWTIYVTYRHHKKVGWKWPLLFWLAMAAGLLIKGITPLVGFLTLITLAISDRSLEIFKKTKFFWGLLLFILCAAWLIPVSLSSHSNFLWDMIHGDVVPKLLGGQESHGMPPGYFIFLFTLMFWPGALFVWHGNMWGWNHRRNPIERFLLAWIIPTWIFFALVPTKLPQYILPTYPAIAILIAMAITNWKSNRWYKMPAILNKIQYGIWALFGLGLASSFILLPLLLNGELLPLGLIAATIMVLIIIVSLVNIYYQNYLRAAVINIIGFSCVIALIFQWMLPNLKPLWISEKIAVAVHHYPKYKYSLETPLLSVGYGEPSLVFLMGTHNVIFLSIQDAFKQLKVKRSNLVVITDRQAPQLLNWAKENGIVLNLLKTIRGYNYSNGRWITLELYERHFLLERGRK